MCKVKQNNDSMDLGSGTEERDVRWTRLESEKRQPGSPQSHTATPPLTSYFSVTTTATATATMTTRAGESSSFEVRYGYPILPIRSLIFVFADSFSGDVGVKACRREDFDLHEIISCFSLPLSLSPLSCNSLIPR